ncbi:MAG: undecaprenyldiphospho-muramoylpentapeptide beta-N-acetylglucosaminyltransferase [Terriglobales bacterium]
MRAILAGGGTGGHVIPGLAIAHELRARYAAEVVFVGTARGIETRLVPAAGYELKLIEVGALKKVSLATRFKTLFALPRAILAARRLINEFKPDVVIGVGGYASGPAMLAAVLARVPTIAFEPNLVPGLANRIVGRMVSAAAVQFEQTCRYFRNCRVTGVPVRQAFFSTNCHPERAQRAKELGERPERAERSESPNAPPRASAQPTLLVFGGSQGAHAINQTLTAAIATLYARVPGLHVIHQTGQRDFEATQAAYLDAGVSAEVYPFIEQMPETFARADLLVCRSGASTVAEITAAAKPAIFVPFPHAADDHQTKNAEALVAAGAAVLLPETQLTPERLVESVASLLNDRARLAEMAAAARRLAHPGAAVEVARMAAELSKSGDRVVR